MIRAAAVALALAGASPAGAAPLAVVATTPDVRALVAAVGGDRVAVESLAAPGEDPHAVDLKPSQRAHLLAAALLVRIGLDHEPWLARARIGEGTRVLNLSHSVRLLQTATPRLRAGGAAHLHAFGNPHYWLDPDNARAMAAAIAKTLAELRPGDAAWFEARRAAFAETLARRTREWEERLAPYRGTRLVVVHDSWVYLAERFGLRIAGAVEATPGIPPSSAELGALVARMREARIRVLVAEPYSDAPLVRRICERTGAREVVLQASGDDYVRLLDEDVARLAQALASP